MVRITQFHGSLPSSVLFFLIPSIIYHRQLRCCLDHHNDDLMWYRMWCGMWCMIHDDVIKWTHFPRYWSFVRGLHRSPVNSPHKGQWRGTLIFPLICTWINGRVNNREAGDLSRNHVHYDVTAMIIIILVINITHSWIFMSLCLSAGCSFHYRRLISLWRHPFKGCSCQCIS